MNKYTGEKCPVCGQAFRPEDDIVVCPDCGAPYHRHCFDGECQFTELHEQGKSWKAEPPEPEYDFGANGGIVRCSRCGTANDSSLLFCAVCGTPLGDDATPSSRETASTTEGQPNQQGSPFFRTMAYNPFTTPYGGLSPDEEIDGVPVKDLAIFVGDNSQYFLPRFKQMKNGTPITFNWAACLLDFFYMLYRKMYGWGIVVLLFDIVTAFSVVYLGLSQYSSTAIIDQATLMTINGIMNVASLMIRLLCGVFANRLYMNRCFRKVRKIKETTDGESEYYRELTRKGSVSRKAVVVVLAIYLVLYLAAFYFMMITGG